jgi:hypothetical protein
LGSSLRSTLWLKRCLLMAGIMPRAYASRNVGAGHRLRLSLHPGYYTVGLRRMDHSDYTKSTSLALQNEQCLECSRFDGPCAPWNKADFLGSTMRTRKRKLWHYLLILQPWNIRQAIAVRIRETGIAKTMATTPVAESLRVRKLKRNWGSGMTDFFRQRNQRHSVRLDGQSNLA